MAENMEKGMNFVNPPEKAESMAYAEEEQRAEDRRRERAGLATNPDLRNEVANEEGEKWEASQQLALNFMAENASRIEDFLKGRSYDSRKLSLDFTFNKYLDGAENVISEKIKAYLGEDFPEISFDCILEKRKAESHRTGTFILERKEIQEE
jgi:hypothetical protein